MTFNVVAGTLVDLDEAMWNRSLKFVPSGET
jgi:hypothetical protein